MNQHLWDLHHVLSALVHCDDGGCGDACTLMMAVVWDALYTVELGACWDHPKYEVSPPLRCEQVGKVTPVSKARVAQKNGQWAWDMGTPGRGDSTSKATMV